jgi:hypothetical protein
MLYCLLFVVCCLWFVVLADKKGPTLFGTNIETTLNPVAAQSIFSTIAHEARYTRQMKEEVLSEEDFGRRLLLRSYGACLLLCLLCY